MRRTEMRISLRHLGTAVSQLRFADRDGSACEIDIDPAELERLYSAHSGAGGDRYERM
jgi:hypothetical protein